MPRFVVEPRGDTWAALRAAIGALAERVAAEHVDLNGLGKDLGAVVRAARAVFGEAGLPSVRLAAAAKALDPVTKRSQLEAFARED